LTGPNNIPRAPTLLELELLKLAFELRGVRIAVVGDLGETPFVDGSLRRGIEIVVPRWLAKVLLSKGLAVQLEEGSIHRHISKVMFAHTVSQSRALPQIEDFFYLSSSEALKQEMERAQQNLDFEEIKSLTKALKQYNTIASRRLSTIIRALSLEGYSSIERSLSIEEKILAINITRILEAWKRALLSIEAGEK